MKHISFLKNEEGMAISDNDGMCALVNEYFENVFAGSCEIRHNVAAGNDGLISESQNANLVAKFSYEEFTIAVKQMHPKKSSGPDGLNPVFFQHFWSCFGLEVFNCCKSWLADTAFPLGLNDTNVVLIPKKDDADNMKDLRPIALCNVL